MGDFNSSLASNPENKDTYHDKINLNEQLLYDYVQEEELLIENTHFRKINGNYGHSYQIVAE